ncbi:Protein of unknown function [Cotesia congregata]|uniref:Uncharacterized protein n=1 Tax=Cotesia congregata TaxID=51543 RepID=A0A8J2HRZ1_COTCN|nr:Protein of unknown function [Cotesia congregata]
MEMEMNAEMERPACLMPSVSAGLTEDGSESGEPSAAGSSAGSIYCTLERDYARVFDQYYSLE